MLSFLVLYGAILQDDKFVDLIDKAITFGRRKKLLIHHNLILNTGTTGFIWLSASQVDTFDAICQTVEDKHDDEHQMLLYPTGKKVLRLFCVFECCFVVDEPILVAAELNSEETDPNYMIVHVFRIDENKKSIFVNQYNFETYMSMSKFPGLNEKMKPVFSILREDGTKSPGLNFAGSIKEIEGLKKKFVTVIIEEKQLQNTKSTSSFGPEDYITHDAYIVAFITELAGKVEKDKMRLLSSIRDVNCNMEKHNLYYPTISICQGSGSGKTKLACSLDAEIPCAYVVLRLKDELAYPQKSRLGDLFFNCALPCPENSFNCKSLGDTNIGIYVNLIYAITADYLARVKVLKSDKRKLSSRTIRKTILKEFVEGKFFGPALEKFQRGDHIQLSSSIIKTVEPEEIERLSKEISKELGLPSESSPLILILDEVDLLGEEAEEKTSTSLLGQVDSSPSSVSRLRLLRRAMHALGTKSGLVFLTLGTRAVYMKLNPKVGSDSMRDDKRSELYPPFIISRNTDIFNTEISKLEISPAMLMDPRMVLVRFAMGRPLWCSLAISQVLTMAKKKLQNSSMETGEALIACWILRTGIPASPHMIDTIRQLVKSNMATLLDIHPNLPLMNICYPSEPALGMAAQKIVDENLVSYFKMLRNYLVCKGFDRVYLAETLTAEICLQAVYKANRIELDPSHPCQELNSLKFINSKKFILQVLVDAKTLEEKANDYKLNDCSIISTAKDCMKLTTLENFLKSLYKDYYHALNLEESIDKRMLKGLVDFNHFIRLNKGFPLTDFFEQEEIGANMKDKLPEFEDPTISHRKFQCRGFNQLGLKRGAAFFMPEGYPGLDLFIPICLESNQMFFKYLLTNFILDDDSEPKNQETPVEVEPAPAGKLSYASAAEKATQSPKEVKRPTTLAMLSIQVKAGSLNAKEKRKCARKMFLDNKFIRCSKNENCMGCENCETQENIEFMLKNQISLVFTFGPGEPDDPPVKKLQLQGDGRKIPSSSRLTVIFNNGPKYLQGLWGAEYEEIIKIVNEIISFSWLPHNFIDRESGTGPYHRNQLLENYLDKPIFPEFSDIFRDELGWTQIQNSHEQKENYEKLIKNMKINK